ncbi:hypothetical protein IWX92DRAFT_85642 [Phyllosticta citricarpa]
MPCPPDGNHHLLSTPTHIYTHIHANHAPPAHPISANSHKTLIRTRSTHVANRTNQHMQHPTQPTDPSNNTTAFALGQSCITLRIAFMRPCRRDGRLGPGSATVYLFLSFSLSFLVFLDHEQAFTFFFFFFFFVCRAGPDCSVRCFICRRERERESVCVCVGLDRLGSTCLRKRRSWGVGGGGFGD